MPILRLTAEWSNFRGAPGYSNFYFRGASADLEDPAAHAARINAFFAAFGSRLPTGVDVRVRDVADNIDESNGAIIGQVDFTAPSSITGTGSGGYSAASGAVVNWNTTAYKGGRRVRGRTFLVPLSGGAYDAQGDLTSATLTDIRTGASALVSNPGPSEMVVWSRPKGGAGGSAHTVTSATVPDLGAILRSRRD